MFQPQNPEEIERLVKSIAKRLAQNKGLEPEQFYDKLQPLIDEAIEWQTQNPTKSAYGNFRVDLKAKYLMQELLREVLQ